MSTIQLTPKVVTLPTYKALKSIDEAFSGLFSQSLFLHCERHTVSDDEAVIIVIGNGYRVALNIQPMTDTVTGGGVA